MNSGQQCKVISQRYSTVLENYRCFYQVCPSVLTSVTPHLVCGTCLPLVASGSSGFIYCIYTYTSGYVSVMLMVAREGLQVGVVGPSVRWEGSGGVLR